MTKENLSAAEAILAIDKKLGLPPSWGVKQHVACLRKRIMDTMDEANAEIDAGKVKAGEAGAYVRNALGAALLSDGIGGNASQFRQALVKAGKLPATVEAAAGSDPYANA